MAIFELIVPAYNEAKNLPLLVERAARAGEEAQLQNSDFQLVIVNNGSLDNSQEVLHQLAKGSLAPWFRVVEVKVNQGYGFGVHQGLLSTKAPIIGWSHADLQCDPKDAIKAWKIIMTSGQKKMLVKGVRSGRDWKDRLVSRVFQIFSRVILGLKFNEINAQPKVFHRELLVPLISPPKNFAFDLYVLYHAQKADFQISLIDVLFPPRIHGTSNWAANFFSRYKTILGIILYLRDLQRTEGRL